MPVEDLFPRSQKYDLAWVLANQMGPNVLWLTESLTNVMALAPGSRVLDLGCGRALSSIFLAREFGVHVVAADLWISPTENLARIGEAGLEGQVLPIRMEAHQIPFAENYFDAVVSMDAFHYFGTDVHYLETHLLKHLKPGGRIGIVSPASPIDLPTELPKYMTERYYWMNSAGWWRRHWERTGILTVDLADSMPEGWQSWVQWQEAVAPDNHVELDAVKADQGDYLGYVRVTGRRRADVELLDPIESMSVPPNYISQPLLRRGQ